MFSCQLFPNKIKFLIKFNKVLNYCSEVCSPPVQVFGIIPLACWGSLMMRYWCYFAMKPGLALEATYLRGVPIRNLYKRIGWFTNFNGKFHLSFLTSSPSFPIITSHERDEPLMPSCCDDPTKSLKRKTSINDHK